MKKTTIITATFIAFMFIACSKNNGGGGSQVTKVTTVSVQNTIRFGIKIDSLYIAELLDTSYDQLNKDTASNKIKIIRLGPLPVGQTSATATLDPMYKSYMVVYRDYNDILNREFLQKVTRLSDGTNMDPYVIKPGEAKVIVLDDNTQSGFMQ